MLLEIQEVAIAAGKDVSTPSGPLRINAPESFSIAQLGSVLPAYRRRYPEVKLEIILSDRMVDVGDVVEQEYDLAIHITRIHDVSLIARRIAPARLALCAALGGRLVKRTVKCQPATPQSHFLLCISLGWCMTTPTPSGCARSQACISTARCASR